MISIYEAVEILKSHIPEKRVITVPLADSVNKVAAKDILSPEHLPGYTNSAMDGYAVQWEDVKQADDKDPVVLVIAGESSAGNPFTGKLQSGSAITISTGAMIPDGADTVIPVENTEFDDENVKVFRVSFKGKHIRYAGEELKEGETVIKKNEVINPSRIALLGLLGIREIPVYAGPKVAVLTTGSELVPLDSRTKKEWQIRDSNRIMLEKAVLGSGGEISFSSTVGDDFDELKKLIDEAERSSDIILLSGGVSVGRHDYVKQAAGELRFKQLFWQVKQKPGKPLFLSKKDNCILAGLPGNPVSSLNCYAYYIHPLIMHIRGREFRWDLTTGILAEDIVNKGSRSLFCRIKIHNHNEKKYVIPISGQGSHKLTTISEADGFVIVEPGSVLRKNEIIELFIYPWEK